jgi:hypothetical protein
MKADLWSEFVIFRLDAIYRSRRTLDWRRIVDDL